MALNTKKLAGRIMPTVWAAGGGAASALTNLVIPTTMNKKLVSGLKIVVGAVIPELSKKTKGLENFGHGFAGVGAAELIYQFVPKSAPEATVAGVGAVDVVNIDDKDIYTVTGNEDAGATISGNEEKDSVVSGLGNCEK